MTRSVDRHLIALLKRLPGSRFRILTGIFVFLFGAASFFAAGFLFQFPRDFLPFVWMSAVPYLFFEVGLAATYASLSAGVIYHAITVLYVMERTNAGSRKRIGFRRFILPFTLFFFRRRMDYAGMVWVLFFLLTLAGGGWVLVEGPYIFAVFAWGMSLILLVRVESRRSNEEENMWSGIGRYPKSILLGLFLLSYFLFTLGEAKFDNALLQASQVAQVIPNEKVIVVSPASEGIFGFRIPKQETCIRDLEPVFIPFSYVSRIIEAETGDYLTLCK